MSMALWLRYNAVLRPLASLPMPLAYRLASQLGRYDQWRQPGPRGAIGHALGLMQGQLHDGRGEGVAQWTRSYFAMMARETLDVFNLPRLDRTNIASLVSLTGLEQLDAAREEGRGVILVMAHYGRLIMPLAALGLSGRPLSMLTMAVDRNPDLDPVQRTYLKRKIGNLLTHMGGRWISLEDDLRGMYQALRNGETLVMLLDAWMPHFGKQIEIPFLGGQLSLPSGIARLAQKTGAAMVYCAAHERDWRIEGVLHRLDDTPEAGLRGAVRLLEEDVRSTPWAWWQWTIFQHIWRHSPV